MLRTLSFAHRWLGGLVGLGLAALGLSGAALMWKPWWVDVAQDPRLPTEVETLAIISAGERLGAAYVTLPSAEFGVTQAGMPDGGGAYLAHDGTVLTRWDSVWGRPETWLFDLHHHLLMGETGELISGWLGIAAVLFCVSGLILWWPTRRTFQWRALPVRLTRPSIIRHHRDIGVVLALPILLASVTGAMMVLRPLGETILAPLSSPAEVRAWQAKPPLAPVASPAKWQMIFATARARFPDAEARMIIWPKAAGEAVTIRMRRPAEWHPNGRTTVTLTGDGTVLMARDSPTAPLAVRAGNALYPLHSARMAGSALALPLRVVMTLAGIGLALLGSLTVVTFWRTQSLSFVAALPSPVLSDL
jgi:uncharacterized iron-regulated membrane protein